MVKKATPDGAVETSVIVLLLTRVLSFSEPQFSHL